MGHMAQTKAPEACELQEEHLVPNNPCSKPKSCFKAENYKLNGTKHSKSGRLKLLKTWVAAEKDFI